MGGGGGVAVIYPSRNPLIPPLNFQGANGNQEASRQLDEAVLMDRIWIGTEL